MNKGSVAMYGAVSEVYSHGRELKEMGLNVPEITDVFLRLHEKGVPCRTDIFTVDDAVSEFRRLQGVTV